MAALIGFVRAGQVARIGGLGSRYFSGEISKSVVPTVSFLRSTVHDTEIFLLGTAHISRKSAIEASELIRFVKPNVVFVELCAPRAERLRRQEWNEKQESSKLLDEFFKSYQNDFVANMIHKYFSHMYAMFKTMNLVPGLEFKVAMEESEKLKATLVYGDQTQKETLTKLVTAAKSLQLPKLIQKAMTENKRAKELMDEIAPNLFDPNADIEDILDKIKSREKIRKLTGLLDEFLPEVSQVLLHERDEYMANKLLQLRGRVVAVVGMAHMDGIEKHWNLAQDKAIKKLQ